VAENAERYDRVEDKVEPIRAAILRLRDLKD